MKDNIISVFLAIFIFFVICITIVLSLDLCSIIELPEKFSLKTYLSKSVETIGVAQEEGIYYPDYNATGIQNLNSQGNAENVIENQSNTDLSNIINNNSNIQNNTSNKLENNITDNSFFYNQLDTYGKTIYSKLYSNLDNLKSGDYVVDFGITFNDLLQRDDGEQTLTNAFQLSINALLLDHPEIFYLDVTKMFLFTEATTNITGTTYKITIGPDSGVKYLTEGFSSKADILIAEDKINTKLYSIKSRLEGNVYDQIVQVHNYLVDNITYDSNSTTNLSHGIYGALINNLAVCDGYAKAFKFILDDIGISCVEICGIGHNSSGKTESHAWNDVLIDGVWYAVDVTWDDPIIIGGNGNLTNDLRYNYFLKGSDTFFSSHEEDGYIVENGKFDYPILSSVGYN